MICIILKKCVAYVIAHRKYSSDYSLNCKDVSIFYQNVFYSHSLGKCLGLQCHLKMMIQIFEYNHKNFKSTVHSTLRDYAVLPCRIVLYNFCNLSQAQDLELIGSLLSQWDDIFCSHLWPMAKISCPISLTFFLQSSVYFYIPFCRVLFIFLSMHCTFIHNFFGKCLRGFEKSAKLNEEVIWISSSFAPHLK